ncbi:MAG TPA: hypothetical protein VK880_14805, partial [Anaerolineales bacterium]|nr:hypothetical protein [Anaerolineales bacterium]
REFIIQSGIALTILTGFAVGDFRLTKWTFIWLGAFAALYTFWLLVGYPQVLEERTFYFDRVLPIDFSYEVNYVINRATKLFMFLAYLTLFPPLRATRTAKSPQRERRTQPEDEAAPGVVAAQSTHD